MYLVGELDDEDEEPFMSEISGVDVENDVEDEVNEAGESMKLFIIRDDMFAISDSIERSRRARESMLTSLLEVILMFP